MEKLNTFRQKIWKTLVLLFAKELNANFLISAKFNSNFDVDAELTRRQNDVSASNNKTGFNVEVWGWNYYFLIKVN